MSRRQRAIYRLLVRILPASFRARTGTELETAAACCVERERARLGRPGVLVAWVGILVDLIRSAVALRRPARSAWMADAAIDATSSRAGFVREMFQEIHMPRLIRGHRGYALLAVTSLSLAVGATLAVFTVVNALWFRLPPIPDIDRAVMLVSPAPGERDGYALVNLETSTRWNVFESFAGQVVTSGDSAGQTAHLTFDAVGREVETLGVTSKYFQVLGQRIRGRDFSRDDNRPGAEPVTIISDRLWERAFDRRSDVIGALASAEPISVRIVGVAPAGFEGARRGEHVDMWLPAALAARLSPSGDDSGNEGGSALLLARLRPGQTPAAAKQQLLDLAPDDRSREYIEPLQIVPVSRLFGSPSSRTIVIDEGRAAGVVAGLAALVLLGSCATLMALVLVHYERRRRELSVRLALGASRRRLAAQLANEFGWLAGAGTTGALIVAAAGLQILPALSLPGGVDLGRLDLSIDLRVLGAALALTLLTLAAAAFVPLVRFTHGQLAGEIVAVRSTTSASSQRLRQSLLAIHVAATIVVLVSAGLFVRAVVYGFTNGAGFDVDRTVSVRLRLPSVAATSNESIRAALDAIHGMAKRIADGISALPGVDAVAIGWMPIGPERMYDVSSARTIEAGGEERQLVVGTLRGGPDLAEALGLRLLAGRGLAEDDATGRGGLAPALVTDSLARAIFPSGDPIGQRILVGIGGRGGNRYEIVGVVADFAYGSMTQPSAGTLVTIFDRFGIGPSFVVHTSQPESAVEPIRQVISDLVPDAHRVVVTTGRDIVARDLGPQRLGAWFFSGFGLIALVLGAGGVFGLVGYLAESRRREFGVRVALGATPRDLVRRGVAAGLAPVAIGAAAGLLAAALISQLFVSSLPGLSALDPITYAGVVGLMTTCAFAASLGAAWRLRSVAPAEALRTE